MNLICKFCNKECKSIRSHRSHELACPKNANRKYKNGMLGKTAWNKGKTKSTDIRVKENGDAIAKSFAENGHKGFTSESRHSDKTKDLMSIKACARLQKNSKYTQNIEYKGVILESTFEVRCAEILDSLDIEWEKVRKGFIWDDNGKTRRYIPDFYLPKYDVYLDPKNDFLIKKDDKKIKSAMQLNDIVVIVMSENDINEEFLVGVTRGEWGRL